MKGCELDSSAIEGVCSPSRLLGWSVRSDRNLTEWVVYCGVLEAESSGRKHGPPIPLRGPSLVIHLHLLCLPKLPYQLGTKCLDA